MNEVILGDCVESMRGLLEDSVDCVVTDPPYGYSFMGKDWDKAVPSVDVWRECLRVLKVGAFMFVMSSPRQDVLSQMIVRIGEAGFNTGFTSIYWAYASGFPKAMNISRMCDKKKTFDNIEVIRSFLRERLKDVDRSKIAQLCDVTERQVDHWIKINESEPQIPSLDKWSTLKKNFDIGDKLDRTINWTNLGEIIGQIEQPITWNSGDKTIRKATTPQAKALIGSYGGFQPKPAVEVILVCMKPLSEKTFVDQALRNGKGVTWLDDARIPFQNDDDEQSTVPFGVRKNPVQRTGFGEYESDKGVGFDKDNPSTNQKGRFPANLLASDDILNDGINHKVAVCGQSTNKGFFGNTMGSPNLFNGRFGGDEGSFSRFFDLDAWFRETFKKLPAEVQRTFPFLIVPKASKGERNEGLRNGKEETVSYGAGLGAKKCKKCNGWIDEIRKRARPKSACYCETPEPYRPEYLEKTTNVHPTVKPLALMSYLITLGSRLGDVVLDPFVGSGTTCLAAKMLGRKWIGIDNNPEYMQIANARLNSLQTLDSFSVLTQKTEAKP